MLTERLLVRCQSAQMAGIAFTEGYALEFSKRSNDLSGKATLNKVDEPKRRTYGVLFEINNGDLPGLDRAEGEGFGYDRVDDFSVTFVADGKSVHAKTYIASANYIDTRLVPYDWYKALVIRGALQHGLPTAYITSLRDVAPIEDPDLNRISRKQAIEVLASAGVQDITQLL